MKQVIFAIFMLTSLYLILNTISVFAQSKILINEFLIDPQPQSVEIFNSGTESTDISDWIIDDSGGTTFYTIPKDSIIFPNQCLIFSSDFNLNKTSADTVRLINNSQQLIDSFSYKFSSGSGISYYRFPDNDNFWTAGSANLGKFNSNTEQACLFPTLTPTPTVIPTIIGSEDPSPTETSTPTPQSYNNIYISEAFVNPPTGGKEWVEIYNNNDFPVSLNNWYIDDLENAGSSPKIFSIDLNAKGYGIFDLTSSIFNNDGDSVRLLDSNKNLKDDFEYQKTEQGKTLGRTSLDSDDFCLQEPSKNSVNNPCINSSSIITSSISSTQINLSPTINSTISDVSTLPAGRQVHRSINYPTGASIKNLDNEDVLGITSTTTNNNSLFIRCLTFVSISYSLLTIISILFKMKLSYGKSQKIYSSSFHSP